MHEFDFHDFVMETLRKMVGSQPEYKVRLYALHWFEENNTLDQRDLAEIDNMYAVLSKEEEASVDDVE